MKLPAKAKTMRSITIFFLSLKISTNRKTQNLGVSSPKWIRNFNRGFFKDFMLHTVLGYTPALPGYH